MGLRRPGSRVVPSRLAQRRRQGDVRCSLRRAASVRLVQLRSIRRRDRRLLSEDRLSISSQLRRGVRPLGLLPQGDLC